MINDVAPQTIVDVQNAENDLRLAIQAHSLGMLRSLQICFPACVYSYNRKKHTVEVMPLVKQAFYNGRWHFLRRKPFEVAIRNIQCGGFTIDFPMYVGDTGWVFSSDRDTLLLKETGALTNSVLEGDRPIPIVEDEYQQVPYEPILHTFSRGFFIPDNWGKWETHRYKDDPSLAIDSGLYIGTSFDTNDNRDDTDDKQYQKGKGYEQNTSSSIVMKKHGGVSLASSTRTEYAEEDDKKELPSIKKSRTHVRVEDGKTEIVATADYEFNKEFDAENFPLGAKRGQFHKEQGEYAEKKLGKNTTATIDEDGIEIQSLNFGGNDLSMRGRMALRLRTDSLLLSLNGLRILYDSRGLSLSVESNVNVRLGAGANITSSGPLNISNTYGDVNLNVPNNAVRVNAGGDVEVNGKNVNVLAGGDAVVTSNGKVDIKSAKGTIIQSIGTINIASATAININGGKEVSVVAAEKISLIAPNEVTMTTAGTLNLVAQEPNANINIRTLSKESKISLVGEGEHSSIKISASYIDINAGESLTVIGRDTSIQGDVTEIKGSAVWLDGWDTLIKGSRYLTLKSKDTYISGTSQRLGEWGKRSDIGTPDYSPLASENPDADWGRYH